MTSNNSSAAERNVLPKAERNDLPKIEHTRNDLNMHKSVSRQKLDTPKKVSSVEFMVLLCYNFSYVMMLVKE